MTSTQAPALLGGTAIKPVERHGMEAVKWFFWDPQKRAVMGRTGKSWALILTFYVIYYAFLAAFWILMWFIFSLTISNEAPKWTGGDSLIGTSPGLGLRPSQPSASIDSSMIIWNKDSELSTLNEVPGYGTWKRQINNFLNKDYNQTNTFNDKNIINCPVDHEPNADTVCRFDLRENLQGCAAQGKDHFGYSSGRPCLYLKLNRIVGVPNQPYNDSNNLPKEMPEELKMHIGKQRDKNQVWVHCQGENAADREIVNGNIEYFPKTRGFPAKYFPYKGQLYYQSPVVAIRLKNIPVGQLVHIECRAWAKNIGYVRMHRIGMVHFEIFMLDNATGEMFNYDSY